MLERVIFARHAEQHGIPGVREDGEADAHSLTVRGWQRAGAMARLFAPGTGMPKLSAIFASRVGPGSETRRPQQTAAPLVALWPGLLYDTRWLKTEIEPLMAAVKECSGTVLVVWEHSMLPHCIAHLDEAPSVHPERMAARTL